MTDRQHMLEERALRNVRNLFERLERADREGRRADWRMVGVIALLTLGALAALALSMRKPAVDPAVQARRACELDAFNAKAADFERTARAVNPGMPYRDIQKLLEKERPSLAAAARIDCDPAAK